MKIEDFSKLAEPFSPEDIEWRIARSGFSKKTNKVYAQVLAYLTSRAVQDRLDKVCGPDGWQTEITKIDGAYLCKMSVRIDYPDGKSVWISKTDGSDETNIEAVKGGISGSIKRAAVQFQVGRYLYDLKDNFATISDKGKYQGEYKDDNGKKQYFRWDPPALPSWALPKSESKKSEPAPSNTPTTDNTGSDEVKELIKKTLDFIADGTINGELVERAKDHIAQKNIEGLRKTISWCESNKKGN